MSNSRFLPIAILTVISLNGFSQSKDTSKHSSLPTILGGVGVTYFNGNIDHGSGITAYSTVRTGYVFGIEERPVSFLGIQLNGVFGKLAASERSNDTTKNKNFQSNFVQGELLLNLHFDGLFIDKNAAIAPYIYTGISYMSYSQYTDLKDAHGNPYYYWTDGSIRNEQQNAADVITAQIVQRDYNYETFVRNGSTICVPAGVGAKLRLTENLALNIQAAYYFTFTNSIENTVTTANPKNDKYLFSYCTIEYHFTKKNKDQAQDETRYQKVDFGVISTKDTLKTKDISKEQEAALLAAEEHRDTSAVDRSDAFNKDPNAAMLANIDKEHHATDPNKLPARFRPADKNHDGYISSQEITQSIDEFFDGTSTLTIADINALIDYFFDQ
ncbi:MAG TPA: hypothetical protein VNY36_03560 [Bacteroidia bacterium]|nr:hypothetical protein [Bacteroidia bacterium]